MGYSDASDVSSNDFSGPEDGECESDEEGRKSAEFGRKNPGPDLGPNSADFVRQKSFRRTLPPVPEAATPIKPDFETREFDIPLEDISPDREVGVEEDPVDPFADFVPEEAKEAEFAAVEEFPREPECTPGVEEEEGFAKEGFAKEGFTQLSVETEEAFQAVTASET